MTDFGEGIGDKDGNIIIGKLKPNAKIKELTHYPSSTEVKALAEQGYTGARFPEKGMQTIEDFPLVKVGVRALTSNTTVVFDPTAIQVIKSKFSLIDFYNQATQK